MADPRIAMEFDDDDDDDDSSDDSQVRSYIPNSGTGLVPSRTSSGSDSNSTTSSDSSDSDDDDDDSDDASSSYPTSSSLPVKSPPIAPFTSTTSSTPTATAAAATPNKKKTLKLSIRMKGPSVLASTSTKGTSSTPNMNSLKRKIDDAVHQHEDGDSHGMKNKPLDSNSLPSTSDNSMQQQQSSTSNNNNNNNNKRRKMVLPLSSNKLKLPLNRNVTSPDNTSNHEDKNLVVQATVVNSSDDEHDHNDVDVQAKPIITPTNGSKSITTSSTSSSQKKNKIQISKPSLATPAVASEKRILLHAGPAEGLPPGWTIKHYKRTTGLKHTDRYWFSPLLKKKFRSLAQVARFLDFLEKENGDEAKAWELFRTSPPGPDEIRSRSNHKGKGEGGAGDGAADGSSSKKNKSSSSSSIHGSLYGSNGYLLHHHGTHTRPLKITPNMSSPGLYVVVPPSLLASVSASSNPLVVNPQGHATPSSIFKYSLNLSGFTEEKLKQAKYYGSSKSPCVDDLFDSSVILNNIELIPKDIWNQAGDALLEKISCCSKEIETYSSSLSSKYMGFEDMLPKSLTLNLPESFIEKRREYYEKVSEREEKIDLYHKQKEEYDTLLNQYDDLLDEWNGKKEKHERNRRMSKEPTDDVTESALEEIIGPMPTPPDLPPDIDIPDLPVPPTLDLETDTKCIPENKKYLVSHLDPECFLLPNGRYYGLDSNGIADPQFVGPNAPGITVSSTNSSSLVTSHMNLNHFMSSTMNAISSTSSQSQTKEDAQNSHGPSSVDQTANVSSLQRPKTPPKSAVASNINKQENNDDASMASGANPTMTSQQLKRLMNRNDDKADMMREAIFRAAVYSSRTGAHSGSFVGFDGEVYPDVCKAFSNHGKIKPCSRCKNNKQGAYHCRLRRQHGEKDYDDGDSMVVLRPYFDMSLEALESSLVEKPKK